MARTSNSILADPVRKAVLYARVSSKVFSAGQRARGEGRDEGLSARLRIAVAPLHPPRFARRLSPRAGRVERIRIKRARRFFSERRGARNILIHRRKFKSFDFAMGMTTIAPSCLREGRQPVTPTDGVGAVPAGGGSSLPLPGGPGIDPAGIRTGARGASLKRVAAGEGNALAGDRVKRGLGSSGGARRQNQNRGGAPRGERSRPGSRSGWILRLSALCLPLFFLEAKFLGSGRQSSGAHAPRERKSFRPRDSGGGGPCEARWRGRGPLSVVVVAR